MNTMNTYEHFSHIIHENRDYFVFIVQSVHNYSFQGKTIHKLFIEKANIYDETMTIQKGESEMLIPLIRRYGHWTGCPCFSPVERQN